MANCSTDQIVQIEIDPQKVNNVKMQGRRNFLRKGISRAATAIMLLLVLNSCTKEHIDDVIGKIPVLGATPETWYNLKVTYKDENGKLTPGLLGPVGTNASTSFWDYMRVDGAASKFKLHPTKDGWAYWEINDGNWLSLKATGWAYRSLEANRVEWKIVDGKLYNNYWSADWQKYPLGAERQRILVSDAYYAGVGLSSDKVFTCELVPAQ